MHYVLLLITFFSSLLYLLINASFLYFIRSIDFSTLEAKKRSLTSCAATRNCEFMKTLRSTQLHPSNIFKDTMILSIKVLPHLRPVFSNQSLTLCSHPTALIPYHSLDLHPHADSVLYVLVFRSIPPSSGCSKIFIIEHLRIVNTFLWSQQCSLYGGFTVFSKRAPPSYAQNLYLTQINSRMFIVTPTIDCIMLLIVNYSWFFVYSRKDTRFHR